MALKAPWNEFPELWGKPASSDLFDILRKNKLAESQDLENQFREQQIARSAKQQALQDLIAQSTQGQDFNSAKLTARDLYAQAGEIESAMGIDQDIQRGERVGQLEDSGYLQSVMEIAKYNPELAQRLYQNWGLEQKHGPFGEFKAPQKKVDIRGGLKEGLWAPNEDGSVNIIRPPAPDKGDKPPLPQRLVLVKDGQYVAVDGRDLNSVNQKFMEGWKPKPGFLDELNEMQSMGLDGGDMAPSDAGNIPAPPVMPLMPTKTLAPQQSKPQENVIVRQLRKKQTTGLASQ